MKKVIKGEKIRPVEEKLLEAMQQTDAEEMSDPVSERPSQEEEATVL